MKLIVTGSTGFVATEIIRQAIHNPAVTSIIALARRETTVPPTAGTDASKLKSVICDDFSSYSEEVKKQLAGADACIWTLAALPSTMRKLPFEEVHKICFEYTATGISTMSSLASNPFRFLYVSGVNAERDQSKKPWIMGKYALLRGKTESHVLDYAKDSKGAVEACVAKPGLIDAPGKFSFVGGIVKSIFMPLIGVPEVQVGQIAAALISQAVNGIEQETLLNKDLVTIGTKALAGQEMTE